MYEEMVFDVARKAVTVLVVETRPINTCVKSIFRNGGLTVVLSPIEFQYICQGFQAAAMYVRV